MLPSAYRVIAWEPSIYSILNRSRENSKNKEKNRKNEALLYMDGAIDKKSHRFDMLCTWECRLNITRLNMTRLNMTRQNITRLNITRLNITD